MLYGTQNSILQTKDIVALLHFVKKCMYTFAFIYLYTTPFTSIFLGLSL